MRYAWIEANRDSCMAGGATPISESQPTICVGRQ